MKIVALGDIHARTNWKQIINENTDCDKFIFIGDYFDTFDSISGPTQINNFKDILTFKRANGDKVILLFGNHEYHYMWSNKYSKHYKGYQSLYAIDIGEVIREALRDRLLQMCHIHDDILFVHAGVTKTWCADNKVDMNDLENSINDLFIYRPQVFEFTAYEHCLHPRLYDFLKTFKLLELNRKLRLFILFEPHSDTGDNIMQTPIWVRPRSLRIDKIDGYRQVVGHTYQDKLIIDKSGVTVIDTLGQNEYLVIEDGKMSARIIRWNAKK